PARVFAPGAVLLACLEVPSATVAVGLRRAKAAGMTTILNPAPADPAIVSGDILPLCDIVTPNQEEIRVLTDLPADTPASATRGARAVGERGARDVIVTLGAAGCLVVTEQGSQLVSACAVEVVDTVGAGDAFNGALAVALAEGRPLLEAASWACAAG